VNPIEKLLQQLKCHLRYKLEWDQETMYWAGALIPPSERDIFGGVASLGANCKSLWVYAD